MSKFNIVLVDHYKDWSNLRPLTSTRPISHIRIGILTIQEKWQMLSGSAVMIKPVVPYLQSFSNFSLDNSKTCFINSAVLPTPELLQAISQLNQGESLYKNRTLLASMVNPQEHAFEKELEYEGEIIQLNYPWDIFTHNDKAIRLDFELLTQNRKSAPLSSTNTLIGPVNQLFIEEGSTVEGAFINTRTGPVYIGKNAEIMEGSAVRGPLALCEGATLKLCTKIYGATTVGPFSKVGGEVNNSVIFGYSNKGHDGFLGNSVLGEWCNLGADTNNSNLKNNYGVVKAWNFEQKEMIDTGLQFLGLIMGDHSKSGINTMFNTGTVVGVSANIFGSGFPPKYIPSFSWGGSEGFELFNFDKALEVAEKVMKRRDKLLNHDEIGILKHIFEGEIDIA
jgi:UDP-N-acetylglucosamine diphosphorylase/glucosamine-1-phosphate N-acetyltransferase